MDDSKKFATPQDEIKHWRELAQKLKQDLEETKEEFEEFQISSKELEAELESQLEQLESKNKELESENFKLRDQNEIYKEKLENLQSQSHKQLTELEDELAQVRAFKDELQKYIRELEQTNDDLERTKRATVVSLEDFESRLNEAIERNAFLESELDQKETLSETVQRLKDEARDLRSELSVVKKKTVTKEDSIENQSSNAIVKTKEEAPVDSNKLTDSGYASCRTPPNRGIPTLNGGGGTPMTPSARISALNIVGDLLRKVGALESKLSTCRNFVKDPSRSGKAVGSSSPSSSPRLLGDLESKEIKPRSFSTTTAGRKNPRLTGVNHIV